MKKLLATVCILSAAVALSACSSEGEGYKDQAPYAASRTAGSPDTATATEEVFHARQVK